MNALQSHERTFYQLQNLLERESQRRIELKLNRNQVSYVSFEELHAGGKVRLRLQRVFLRAPEKVLSSLARWIGTCRGRCPKSVRGFIAAHAEDNPRKRRPVRVRTRGRRHDLAEIMAKVNRDYFRARMKLLITWGRAVRPGRRVSQRQLGSFDRSRNLVTISRVLDMEEVPRFFVAFVVFHEMLHAVQAEGAERDHGPEFTSVERMHPDYRHAVRWQAQNLTLLMHPGARRPRKKARRRPTEPAGPVQGLLF
jgi:hypothetical protein